MPPSTERLRRGLADLQPLVYYARAPLARLRMLPLGTGIAPGELPLPRDGARGWRAMAVGARWGGRDENAWFRADVEVPQAWPALLTERFAVVLRLVLGVGGEFGWPEGLLYVNDRLAQGINRHHPDVLLDPVDVAAGRLSIAVRAWSGMAPGDHRIRQAELALLDRDVEALATLLSVGAGVVETLPAGDPLAAPLAAALDAAYDSLDLRLPASEAFTTTASAALEALRAALAALRARFDPPGRPRITVTGHAHLDVAWLWQTRHTREKAARTFSIATALMRQYPEYVFLHTTPQVYAWLAEDYPEVFARVRERVAEGRFEAAGAMWLESDCNLVSGEALVRQILYGQRFLRETFGRAYDALLLPDAFGYSAALPQILLKAGLRAFMTTKLSWNDTNRMPADTFRWRGIDGSEVLAHFLTTPSLAPGSPLDHTDTYNGQLTVPAVVGAWRRYRQRDLNDELLVLVGYGDGGAGPTRQFIEQARAMAEMPGLPEVRFGRADDYFARLRARVWDDPRLPVWDGELYLEYHRGTYTTQGWLKRLHRQLEGRLLTAELLDAWRWLLDPASAADRRSELDDAWRTLLLHEFHDILPGSSIGEVYADARVALGALAERLDALCATLLDEAIALLGPPADMVVVFNPAPVTRDALVTLPWPAGDAAGGWALAEGGAAGALTAQPVTAVEGEALLVALPALPPMGYRILRPVEAMAGGVSAAWAEAAPPPARAAGGVLENGMLRATFDERGELRSLVDLRVPGGRELVPTGAAGNALEVFEDRPRAFDAWDLEPWVERKRYPVERARVEPLEPGPLRAALRITRAVGASTVTQDVSLARGSARLDFATRADWHDRHLLLKVAFPLDLRARDATYEIAYGAITRPTHRNTSWDRARFEVPAHRWADLSEADYGVSLLNDGRYGYDAHDNVLRLTLLRSPTDPDAEADQGPHEVIFSVLPHPGDWRAGGTVAEAIALNRPPLVRLVHGQTQPRAVPPHFEATALFRAASRNVVVEAVKRAADGEGLIVRLREAHGARALARVEALALVAGVGECDVLERSLTPEASPAYAQWQASRVASHDAPEWDVRGWTCELRPYEVRTFRVAVAGVG